MWSTRESTVATESSAIISETSRMSPLGPVPNEEAEVAVTRPRADRRAPMLLQVVRPADPFYLQRCNSMQDSAMVSRTEMDRVDDDVVATAATKEDEESEEAEIRSSRDEEDEEDDDDNEKRDIDVEGDVEVDVCRDVTSSPVDLTATSRCTVPPEQFVYPRGLFNGVAMTGSGPIVVPTVYHLPQALVCSSAGRSSGAMTATTTTTTANTGQGIKRGLAFSVENILDPHKFTGGRVMHPRMSHHRRRRRISGSVHEGKYFVYWLFVCQWHWLCGYIHILMIVVAQNTYYTLMR